VRNTLARVLALGDSYTLGEGVALADAWPAQVARALRSQGVGVEDPEIIARTGWTTGELAAAISNRRLQPVYTLVTLLIGVNDEYRGGTVSGYRTAFRAVLGAAVQLARDTPTRVIVVSIPDWGVTPFNRTRDAAVVARAIDAFNAVNLAEARATGTHYVNVTDLSRGDPLSVVADGLHPNASMYARWAARIAPVAAAICSHPV
jgi:lysophospholipase L1-like esterase